LLLLLAGVGLWQGNVMDMIMIFGVVVLDFVEFKTEICKEFIEIVK